MDHEEGHSREGDAGMLVMAVGLAVAGIPAAPAETVGPVSDSPRRWRLTIWSVCPRPWGRRRERRSREPTAPHGARLRRPASRQGFGTTRKVRGTRTTQAADQTRSPRPSASRRNAALELPSQPLFCSPLERPMPTLRLLGGYLQPLTPPHALDPLVVNPLAPAGSADRQVA